MQDLEEKNSSQYLSVLHLDTVHLCVQVGKNLDTIWGSHNHNMCTTSNKIQGCTCKDKWEPKQNKLPSGIGVQQIPTKEGNERPHISTNVLKSKGRWVGCKTLEWCGEEMMETNEAWEDLHACTNV